MKSKKLIASLVKTGKAGKDVKPKVGKIQPKIEKTQPKIGKIQPKIGKIPATKKHAKTDDVEALQEELKQKFASKSFEDFVNEDLDSEDDDNFDFENGEEDEDETFEGDAAASDSEDGSTEAQDTEGMPLKGKKKVQEIHDDEDDFLEFDSSDSEDDEAAHKLPDKLEVASDESDYEDGEPESGRSTHVLSQSQIDQWQTDLETDKTTRTISQILGALNSALATLHNEETRSEMRVEGSSAFNSIVRLCLLKVIPAFKRLLKIGSQEKRPDPAKSKTWTKVKGTLRQYTLAIVKLLNGVHSENLVSVVLKHTHQAMHFFACIPKAAKLLVKRLLTLWSTGEESVRVLAFMCLLKLCTIATEEFLEPIMKGMYLAYVKNTKFTSPKTWPGINFMRRSLVEIFSLDDRLAYRHGFLYIRQLAIHLRNAMTLKKKDSLQVVYNWQFIHSLHFWSAVIGSLNTSQNARQLIYPLAQVAIGTINLMPTAKYYPLRFHCAKILANLSSQTKTFIPVLPFYMDVLQNHNFNRKLIIKENFKPLDMSCVLKVSTSQLKEGAYRDAVIEAIHDGVVEYAFTTCHKIAFPETVFPTVMQIKNFVKKCTMVSCTKKMKSVMDKLIDNSKYVEEKRKTLTFGISDTQAIEAWETQLRISGTPFIKFYAIWRKSHDKEVAVRASKSDVINFDNIPVMKKKTKKEVDKEEDEEFQGLFPSGDEDDESDDENRFLPKEERGAAKKRVAKDAEKPVAAKPPAKKSRRAVVKTEPEPVEETRGFKGPEDEVGDLHASDFDSEEEKTAFDSDNEDLADSSSEE